MDLLGLNAKNGPGPGMSPVRIRDHLRLINDSNVIFLFNVKHFNGGGGDKGILLIDPLLTCQHGTGDPCIIHLLIYFQRQKTQGPEIDAVHGAL